MYNFKKYSLAISLAISLGALMAANNHAFAQTRLIDYSNEYCNMQNPRKHVVMIDQTAIYDQADKMLLNDWYQGFVRDLRPGSKIVIYEIRDFASQSKSVFSQCVPTCNEWDDDFSGDFFTERCNRFSEQNDKNNFILGLNSLFGSDLINGKQGNQSPILRSIGRLLQNASGVKMDQLTIISDMVEYDPRTSQRIDSFNEGHARDLLEKVREEFNLPYSLANTRVRIYGGEKQIGLLNTDSKVPELPDNVRESMRLFWTGYFTDILKVRDFAIRTEFTGNE